MALIIKGNTKLKGGVQNATDKNLNINVADNSTLTTPEITNYGSGTSSVNLGSGSTLNYGKKSYENPMPTISQDSTMQKLADMLYGTKSPTLDPTLSYEQAIARARANINPAYTQAFDQLMQQLDKNALKTGFYGQLPAEALKRQAAGSLEVDKMQAVNELASQLFGQSEETAYKKLDSKQQEYQNKLNMMLQLLNLYSSERSYADNKEEAERNRAMKEADYTGMYQGNPTLDFLDYIRLKENQNK